MNLGFWLRHPLRVPARIAYAGWERRNPDKPWLCPGAVRFLEGRLTKEMRGLEFGSGRSTAWLGGHLGQLVSVEDDEAWHRKVRDDLRARGVANVDLRLVPLEHPRGEPERLDYDPTPAYVAALDGFEDESLDLVFVDGHYRTNCILRCPRKLGRGGLLVVDDTDLWGRTARVPAPSGWPLVHESSNGMKGTAVWRKV